MEPAAGPATALDVGAVSVDIPAGTSADPVQADEKVFSANPDIGNAEDYNRQQVAEENGMALGNGGVDGRIISEAGRQKAEADKDEKREAAAEYIQQSAARNDFMNKDHDFGGVKMSGHDLDKLMNFYANNPQMMDQLRDRMTKSGMSKEKADKGVKELQEYMDLKKKEKEGKLTEQDQQRLRELQKSEEFKKVAEEAVQYAQERGVQITPKMEVARAEISAVRVSDAKTVQQQQDKVQDMQASVQKQNIDDIQEDEGIALAELSDKDMPSSQGEGKDIKVASGDTSEPSSRTVSPMYDYFPSAPRIGQEFGPVASQLVAENETTQLQISQPAVSVVAPQKMPLSMGARA